jgi:hypothetical protein
MDQFGGDKFLQVVRDGCLRDRKFSNESLARNLVLSRNAGEDREPLWIGNRLCNLLQLIVASCDGGWLKLIVLLACTFAAAVRMIVLLMGDTLS